MSFRRVGLAAAAGVAVVVALVAVTAAALAADRQPPCQQFPAALGAGTRAVCGPILERYLAEGGPDGMLGRPLDEEAPNTVSTWQGQGDRVVVFTRGAIYLDTATGITNIPGVWTPYAP